MVATATPSPFMMHSAVGILLPWLCLDTDYVCNSISSWGPLVTEWLGLHLWWLSRPRQWQWWQQRYKKREPFRVWVVAVAALSTRAPCAFPLSLLHQHWYPLCPFLYDKQGKSLSLVAKHRPPLFSRCLPSHFYHPLSFNTGTLHGDIIHSLCHLTMKVITKIHIPDKRLEQAGSSTQAVCLTLTVQSVEVWSGTPRFKSSICHGSLLGDLGPVLHSQPSLSIMSPIQIPMVFLFLIVPTPD